jgi:hypothetical protein
VHSDIQRFGQYAPGYADISAEVISPDRKFPSLLL